MDDYINYLLGESIAFHLPFVRNVKNRNLRRLCLAAFSFLAVPNLLAARKRPTVPYVELAVTERCSLNCRACANLMPLYESPRHYPLRDVLDQLDTLEKTVKSVLRLRVLGGEPFVYPELAGLLDDLCARAFVRSIEVVTNGTVLPRPEIRKRLKHKKIVVITSDYGEMSRQKTALATVFKRERIRHRLLEYENWMDYGSIEPLGLSLEAMEQSYRMCGAAGCKTLLKGRLHTCPRDAHLFNLGILSDKSESFDINSCDPAALRAFYGQKTVSACDRCLPPPMRRDIPAAEQVKRAGEL